MKPRLGVAATIAALTLVTGGCSGDEDGGPSTTAPPTREEFIGASDAVCQRVHEESRGAALELFGGPQPNDNAVPAAVAQRMPDFVEPLRAGVTELSALVPPPGDEEQINTMLEELRTIISNYEQATAAAQAGDTAAMRRFLTEAVERSNGVDDLRRVYGFEVCGHVDEAGVQPPADLSAEQRAFIERGDALCAAANAEVDAAFADVFSGDPQLAAGALQTVVGVFTKLFDDLAALPVPAGDESRVAMVIDAERRALGLVAEAQAMAAAGNPDYRRQLDDADDAAAPADRLFKEYGFVECGK